MDALELLRHEAKSSYAWLETNVGDVTQQQATWCPPGTANSIAATYAHTMISADVDLTRHFHGRPPVIASGWAKRLGLGESFPDDWMTDAEINWDLLHQYGREVDAHVQRLVGSLTIADLDRRFRMTPAALGIWKGLDVYTLHVGRHIWMHGGENRLPEGLAGRPGIPALQFTLSVDQDRL